MLLSIHYLQTIETRDETVWFVINCNQIWCALSGAAVITTVSLYYCGFVSSTYAWASQVLIIKIDHLNTMNMWVFYHTVCPLSNHWELVELLDVRIINHGLQLGGPWKAQCCLQRCSIEYKRFCCSTDSSPIQWSCWLYTHISCVQLLVMLTL